jgi:hypothetical protein
LVAAAVAARAQSIEIYSELQRPDPFGGIVAIDSAIHPREILSPAVIRNGHASFHVAVSVPPKETYLLYVVTNPLDACRVALYKEHFAKTKAGWIPDPLTEVHRLPDFGVMPDPDDGIEGQNTRVYLLDLWLPPNADAARFRLEIQLKVADWTVRPMEVRIMRALVPEIPEAKGPATLPDIEQGADAPALGVIREFLAGSTLRNDPQPLTVRGMLRRNAVQDMMLAASPETLVSRVLDLFRLNHSVMPRLWGAEWYLRIRDGLYAR